MIPVKHFYMIRHGETEANVARRMAGSVDTPLTLRGREQADEARLIVEQLEIKPIAIVHSQLSRARDTAHIINKNLKLPIHEDPDLAELHSGDWEGADYETCRPMLYDWQSPPNGETYEQFFARLKRAKKKALESYPGPVLIVCHGGVVRGFWKIYGIDAPHVKNCHLHEFSPAQPASDFPWVAHVYDYDEKLVKTELLYAADLMDSKTRKA